MHGISSIAGNRTVQWNGYTLAPPRLRDFGEKEAYILHLRNERCPQLKLKSATAAHVSIEEEGVFDQSARGIYFRTWQAIRTHHPEFQVPTDHSMDGGRASQIEQMLEKVADIIEEAGKDQLQSLLMALSGVNQDDLLKNSNGQGGPVEVLAESTMKTGVSPGPGSTADLPNGSTGPSSKSTN